MKLSTIRPYRAGDELVRFREEDEAEVAASSGRTCAAAVRDAATTGDVQVGLDARTGEPIAFFGHVPVDGVGTAVWMLATADLARNARSVAVLAPRWIERLHQQHPVLFNCVDARNTLHIRWLKRLGFTFIKLHERFGVEQRPFYEFVRIPYV